MYAINALKTRGNLLIMIFHAIQAHHATVTYFLMLSICKKTLCVCTF